MSGFASQATMSAFDFIADVAKSTVTAAKQRPVLFKATSDDDTPTPGYIYEEISKLTWEDGEKCEDVLNFLVKRLDKDSPAVKLKCLRVLKYCVSKGHESFHRDLQRQVQPIKDATQFRGVPDPLRGDAPAKAVRDAATELLQIVFENPASIRRERPKALGEAPGYSTQGHSVTSISSASSMGSNASSNGSGNTNASAIYRSSAPMAPPSTKQQYNDDGTKKMWGYGNPEFQPAQPNLIDRLKDSVSSSSNAPRPFTTSSASMQAASSSYSQAKFQQASLSSSEDFQQRQPGQVGGGWGSVAPPTLSSSSSTARPYGSTKQQAAAATVGQEEEDDDGEEDEDEEEEEQVTPSSASQAAVATQSDLSSLPEYRHVNEITHLGVRAHPSREALLEFCQRCRSMNGALVAQALVQCLEGEETAPQMRALYVMEALVTEGVSKVIPELQRSERALAYLRSSPKNNIATKAVKVSLLLGFEVTEGALPAVQTQPTQPIVAASQQQQVLSLWDEPAIESPVRITPQPSNAIASSSTSGSLLDFINTSTPQTAPSTDALFSGLSLNNNSSNSSTSSFDFMGGAAPTAATTSIPMSSAQRDLLDLNLTPSVMRQPGVNMSAYMPPPIPGTNGMMMGYPAMQQQQLQQQLQQQQWQQSARPPMTQAASISLNPSLIEKTRYTPNYIVSSAPVQSTSSKSSFGFVDGKRDAFDFVQDELRSSNNKPPSSK